MNDREKDIQKVCNAILSGWLKDGGDWDDYCDFCGTEQTDRPRRKTNAIRLPDGYLHTLDCVVLIAKDLTTGIK